MEITGCNIKCNHSCIIESNNCRRLCSVALDKGVHCVSNSFWATDVIFSHFLFGRGQPNIWFLLPSNLLVWQRSHKLVPACLCASMCRRREKTSHIRTGIWTYRHGHKRAWVQPCFLAYSSFFPPRYFRWRYKLTPGSGRISNVMIRTDEMHKKKTPKNIHTIRVNALRTTSACRPARKIIMIKQCLSYFSNLDTLLKIRLEWSFRKPHFGK